MLSLAFAGACVAADAPSLDDLAQQGDSIVAGDPLSTALRDSQPDAAARRGFDIGVAVAGSDTLPGPGKQRIHDTLALEEQPGFEAAVAFSLERNRNLDLATRGAGVAAANASVSAARAAQRDPVVMLGFDIASGLYGHASDGALGNTAMGPGAQKIRGALSARAQAGFDAGVRYHLGQAAAPAGPSGSSAAGTAALRGSDTLYETPGGTVGMTVDEAYRAIQDARLEPKLISSETPDPTMPGGRIKTTVPPAGTRLLEKAVVELHVPRAASLVGIGSLSQADTDRRDGFDLDAGGYERITHGADIVLVEHRENRANIDADHGAADYIDLADGVALGYDNNNFDEDLYGRQFGSYETLDLCRKILKENPVKAVHVLSGNSNTTFCVITSEHQIAAVRVLLAEKAWGTHADYKFHFALFPNDLTYRPPDREQPRSVDPAAP